MFPSFQSFEEYQKTVEFCIPPCNFSFHSLHFQNQMMITNHSTKHPVNPIPQVGPIADTELEYPIGTDRDNSMSFDPCNAGVRAGAFPKKRQCRFHGAGNDVENVMSETLGGGNVGLGIVPNHPFHLLDGIGAGVCREGGGSFQQVQESENYAENPTPAEKKRRRMIKNRESAARSRARKQAYTTQLEIEVEQLKNENALLRKRKGGSSPIDTVVQSTKRREGKTLWPLNEHRESVVLSPFHKLATRTVSAAF